MIDTGWSQLLTLSILCSGELKIDNLPISNPKQDLHDINVYTKFGENPLTFKLSSETEKKDVLWADNSV